MTHPRFRKNGGKMEVHQIYSSIIYFMAIKRKVCLIKDGLLKYEKLFCQQASIFYKVDYNPVVDEWIILQQMKQHKNNTNT